MNNIHVSVIIPVYNSEKYLEQCLDSVANQTLKNIEIICINDESTDNSLKILEKYAKKDKRIKVISKNHGGAGAARNLGLKHVSGEYIAFVDSDDWIDLNTFEILHNEAKMRDTEIIMFKLINYDDENDCFYEDNYYNIKPLEDFFEKDVFWYGDIKDQIMKVAVSTVNKFYKSSFLSEIGVRFPEGIMFEDNAFFFKCILNAKRISLIDKHLYYRRRHGSSVMASVNKKLFDAFTISNIICDIFVEESLFEFHKEQLVNFKFTMLKSWYHIVDSNYKDEFFEFMIEDFSNFHEYFKTGENFSKYFNEKNSKIYSNLFEAENSKEFDLLNEINDLEIQIKKMKSENKKLNKEIKTIYSTVSWKITKPLRKIRNKFK